VQFYQRLLAHDEDEAFEIVRERLAMMTLAGVFDQIVVPALIATRSDFESGLISESETASVFENVREIVEELEPPPSDQGDAAGAKPAVSRPRIKIFACAARDAADETAVEMFSKLLDPRICAPQVISTDHLVSEIVALVAEEHPAIACIGSLPPGGLSHTRLLCKRLRASFPDLKILVGRWGLRGEAEKRNREQLLEAGADQFGTTLEETAVQLVQLQQLVQSMDAPAEMTPAVATADGPLIGSQRSP